LPKIFSGNPQTIIGAKFLAVRRFGKGLVLDINNGYSIAVHVKMTGQLIYRGKKISKISTIAKEKVRGLPGPFTHVIFYLDNNAILYYNDMRQFGWIKIIPTDAVLTIPFFNQLGPESLKDLTLEKFSEIVNRANTPIKQFLMDQKKIGGIGNIYANDALFVAHIHPKRSASSLTREEQSALFLAIEQVLLKGLEVGGASEWHYVNALGMTGNYQNFFQVYGKENSPCPRCGTAIKRIKLGGRGTFFCSVCQI
jgi:formamidopyrimidine-DNA glycosylase